MKQPLLTTTTLIGLSFLAICVPNPAQANPEGGQVVGGSATIFENGKKLDVQQHSKRAVIDWRSFNIEVDEHTEFHQPSSSATALNRINDVNPSRIAGKLSANGNIILVNPNGVFFEGSSRIDVNGIVATTANIRPEDFMAGSNEFDSPGNPNAAIINEGIITAKDAGFVGLVAPHVENHGIIEARLGRVQLASGDTVTVDFYGDDLLKVAVKDENLKSQFVGNSGVLSADGGTVAMTAAAAKQTVNSLIVAEGLIEAKTIGRDANGAIIIGGEGSNKTEKSGDAYVAVSGYLDASGRNEGEQGGTIEVLGDHIAITETAIIDTSGHSAIIPERKPNSGTATMREDKSVNNGVRTEEDFLSQDSRAGGSIKIGGDYLGKGDMQTAKTVKVSDGALILNNALESGGGGRTIVWSDDTTEFAGLVLSTGGQNGGNGGFLETSGKINLKANGFADLSAQDGFNKGTYLLDPDTITIYGDLDPDEIDALDATDDLQVWLDASDAATITDTAGSVTTWADKSGNGYDFDDVGAGAEPTTGTRTINGLNALEFDGGDRLINSSGAASIYAPNTQIYKFFIGVQDVVAQDIVIYGNNSATGLQGGGTYDGNGGGGSLFELQSGFAGSNVQNFFDDGPTVNSTTPSAGAGNPSIVGGYFDRVAANVSAQSYVNGFASATTTGTAAADRTATAAIIGGHGSTDTNLTRLYDGALGEVIIFHNLTENERALVDQYQSAKWDIALNPLNNAALEIDQVTAHDAGDPTNAATNGYNVFNASYLERLAENADVHLQAASGVTFDLQGDTLDFSGGSAAGKSLTIETDDGDITDISAGTIRTTRTGSGATLDGNINIIAGGTGNITLDTTNLEALNAGVVNLNAGGTISLDQISDLNLGMLNAGGPTSLISAGDVRLNNAVSLTDTLSISAGGDVILDNDITTSSVTVDAIQISATDDFINNAGNDALQATNSNWIVYSDDPVGNQNNGLLPDESFYNQANIAAAIATKSAAGNNVFGYLTATRPTITYDVDNNSVEYGEAIAGNSVTYNSGLVGDDTLGTIGQSGSATFGGYTPGDNVNTYIGGLTGATGTLTNVLGYNYSFNAGDLSVTQADLNISVDPAFEIINQGAPLPLYNLSYGPFKLADTFADLDVLPTITMPSNNVVGSFPVTLSGGSDNNYNYIFTNAILEILTLATINNDVTIPSTVEQDLSTRILENSFNNQELNIPALEARSLPDSQIDIEIEGVSEEHPELGATEEKKRKIKLRIDKDLANQLNLQINDGVL